jgi:hypothetical protein
MSFDTLLIVLAIAMGPTIAVAAAIGYSIWDRVYQRRLAIFHAMMGARRHWLSQDWIGSLNLIPVEFSRFDPVIDAFETLMEKYADPAWKGQEEERRRAVLDTESAACELLMRSVSSWRTRRPRRAPRPSRKSKSCAGRPNPSPQ